VKKWKKKDKIIKIKKRLLMKKAYNYKKLTNNVLMKKLKERIVNNWIS